MKLSELMDKKVICVSEGKELGTMSDAILNSNLTIMCMIVCPKQHGCARWFPFLFQSSCERIDVNRIVNVGSDVILVKKE